MSAAPCLGSAAFPVSWHSYWLPFTQPANVPESYSWSSALSQVPYGPLCLAAHTAAVLISDSASVTRASGGSGHHGNHDRDEDCPRPEPEDQSATSPPKRSAVERWPPAETGASFLDALDDLAVRAAAVSDPVDDMVRVLDQDSR